MKTALKLCVVVLLLLFVLTACDLYNGINVGWSINTFGGSASLAHVTYTVQNLGKYDLTGVNLEIGAYVASTFTGYISAWTTPDFNLAQNEIKSGSIDIDISPYSVAFVTGAAVLGVDMDKPND